MPIDYFLLANEPGRCLVENAVLCRLHYCHSALSSGLWWVCGYPYTCTYICSDCFDRLSDRCVGCAFYTGCYIVARRHATSDGFWLRDPAHDVRADVIAQEDRVGHGLHS